MRPRSDGRSPLLHDTVYRRTRRALIDRVHAWDDAVSLPARRPTRTILFEAASPLSFAIFRPVYDRLRADPRLEFWFTACGKTWTPEAIFRPLGLADRVIPASRAAWMKVDLYLNTDFWDATWQRRRARRVHLFHGVAGKYGLDAPVEIAPTVATFDCLMFPNRDRLDSYVTAGLVSPERAALVGYPKTDCLVDGSIDGRAVRRRLGLDDGSPVVMYAPTWSPHSSLHTMGEDVIAALERAGFQVVVKLHDRSYDPSPRGGGGVDWAARLAKWESHPRVKIVRDADASPYLCASDALVTCHSSVGFEFMLLDRPIVVLEAPDLANRAQINPRKIGLMRSAAEVAGRADRVPVLTERQLADPARHSARRREIARELFHEAGTATTRAVAAIYALLELDAPVPASLASSRVAARHSWSLSS
jgi:CDP-glycerol glycerophosphotransferase